MEIPSEKWLSEWAWLSEDTFFPQHQMAYDDGHLSFNSISPNESNSSFSNFSPNISSNNFISPHMEEEDIKRPAKQLKMSSEYSYIENKPIIITPKPLPLSSSSKMISFENSSNKSLASYCGDDPMTVTEGAKRVGSSFRSPVVAKEHVIAERKRREKMGQLLITLSALIPSLKKSDKASIIEGAANYVKQLQERVGILEERAAKKTVESAIFLKRTLIHADEESSSSDDQNTNQKEGSLPEIEARVSGRDVLITIHCEKNMESLVNILNEVEKLNLSMISNNVMPFGRATVHVTISAQIKDEIKPITATGLVKSLRLALQGSASS